MPEILIVDDDLELCDLLSEYLSNQGHRIHCAHDGQQALDLVKALKTLRLIVMDVMMPRLDGIETLKQLRKLSEIPVIMLTARGDDIDKIIGLELGADDYLSKPFNPRELYSRIKAIFRRAYHENRYLNDSISLGELSLKISSRATYIKSQPINLTNTEFDILTILLKSMGEVCSKEMLSEQGLSKKLQRFDRSVDMHISNLRKKLKSVSDYHENIKTVRGIGYIYINNEKDRYD